MSSSCDRTGFPVLPIPPLGVAIHLFPVTKIQLEKFMVDTRSFGDSWYEQVLSQTPRASYKRFTDTDRERLFATALLSKEVEAFAAWMGHGWFVPTMDLWRCIWTGFSKITLTQEFLDSLPKEEMHPAAIALVRGILGQVQPKTLLDFSLMRGGVMEWVREESDWGTLGEPRTKFAQYPGNPLSARPFHPLTPDTRVFAFGLRLCRLIESATPDPDVPERQGGFDF